MTEKIALLIPAYNEAQTIGQVIADFRAALPEADIYVYDNNSADETARLAQEAGAKVFSEIRQGKGNVVRSMFREIEADYYIMVDADDTYPADEVEKLLEPLRAGRADMTIGDRLSNGTYSKENRRIFHGAGNLLVRGLINNFYQSKIQDIMTGYRGFNRLFVKSFPVLSSGFEIETELSIHALDKRFKLLELPISYRNRPEGSHSKLGTYSDGFKVIRTIFRLFKDYKPMRFFGLLSLIFFLLGILVGLPVLLEFARTHYITHIPLAILAVGLMIMSSLFLISGLILDTIVRQSRMSYELYVYQLMAEASRDH